MYVLVNIHGRQYKAEKGALLQIDRVEGEPGAELAFDEVMLVSDGENVKVGTPYVSGVSVKTKLEDHTKGKKIRVFKYKRRKSYRKSRGHRQHYSVVRVEEIAGV